MEIKLQEISVRDLAKNFSDNDEDGVFGFDGKLNIRPPYQREFVYDAKHRDEVVRTVVKNFPLNIMYWADIGSGNFEIIDGQQRTISICRYVAGDFSVEFEKGKPLYFHSLQADRKESILEYRLSIYQCVGEDSEKLDWFRTINIAGKPLTEQELRNAVYSGSWVTDAKRYFSKNNCVASQLAGDYLNGSAIRQDFLETAIAWVADREGVSIEEYMSKHQCDEDASELWQYFQEVIGWMVRTFSNQSPQRKKLMKGQDWGIYYNLYKDVSYNAKKLEDQIIELIDDDEVQSTKGIYPYLLTGKEKYLSLRAFSEKDKQKMYQKQGGICPACNDKFELSQMDADHIIPWVKGGKTNLDNGQLLCKKCNQTKSSN
ncbi:MAG: DUF262 domain-containing protein [Acinetobacter sp.]